MTHSDNENESIFYVLNLHCAGDSDSGTRGKEVSILMKKEHQTLFQFRIYFDEFPLTNENNKFYTNHDENHTNYNWSLNLNFKRHLHAETLLYIKALNL